MSQLLGKIVPYLFLLYFLIRAYKKPVFLLGIPFLIFFRYCIFFENVKIFTIPGRLGNDVLLLMWLFITELILSSRYLIQSGYKRKNFSQNNSINLLDWFIIGLIIISIADLVLVLNGYLEITGVVIQFFSLVALFLGFFVLKNIVSHTDEASLKDFLFSIVIVNTFASFLYFLHQGLNITIYELPGVDEFQQEVFQGEVITREFWCMPVLWFFSVAYLTIFREGKSVLSLCMLGINLLSIFVSYTRSFMAIVLILFFLYNLLISIKKRSFGPLIKNGILIIFSGIILFFVLSQFLPDKVKYFEERVTSLKKNPNDEDANTLLIRFKRTGEIFRKMGSEKIIAGLGPVTDVQYHGASSVDDTTADMVWTGVVFRWGYIGLIIFALLYLVSLARAYSLFMNSEGILSQLGLLFMLVIISQILESFTSWTFLNPGHFALGLWYFAFLSALIGFDKRLDSQIENSLYE